MLMLNRAVMMVVLMIAGSAAHAIPVTWQLDGTMTNSRTLGNFGDPAAGSSFSATMVVEADTADVNLFDGTAGYYNVFRTLSLSIGTSVLTLGPDSDDPAFAREANSIVTLHEASARVQMNVLLYEGTTPFAAYFWFDFADLGAFPDGVMPSEPPSLASATLREFSIYSPIDGDPRNGAIFLGSGSIDRFETASPLSVPEPGTLPLIAAALFAVGLFSRRDRKLNPA